MLEAGQLRDLLQREVRFGQELLDPHDLQPADLGLRRPSKKAPETLLQLAAGQGGVTEDVLDVDPAARVFADVADRGGHPWILDGENVAGAPRDHARGVDPAVERRTLGSIHERGQRLRREVSGQEGVRADAGEWGIGEVAAGLVIVGSEHRHLLRHQQVHGLGRMDHLQRAQVVACHHTGWLGELPQPLRELPRLRQVPSRIVVVRIVRVEDVDRMARELDRLDKSVASLAGPAVVAESRKAVVPVAALEEVLSAKMPDGGVVRPDLRHAGERRLVVEVHQRQPQLSACLHQLRSGVAADHTLPAPLLQPEWIRLRARFVIQKGVPWAVRARVVIDAAEHRLALLKAGHEHEQDLGCHEAGDAASRFARSGGRRRRPSFERGEVALSKRAFFACASKR